jgi:hypothetical protein
MHTHTDADGNTVTYTPKRYPCRRCGGRVSVTIAEAQAHREEFHPTPADLAAEAAREAARERMSDPEFQAKLQAARAEARVAKEGA